MKKTKILVACFLTVLTVVGAGYAYSLKLSESKFKRSARVYRTLTGEDAARAIDTLDGIFEDGQQYGYSSRELAQIIAASSRASSAVGYLGHGKMRESGLYAFFCACERAAFDCLAGQGDMQILDELAVFSHKIKEAGADFTNVQKLEESFEALFAAPEFEALMHGLGTADFAVESDFHSLVSREIGKKDAKKIAEKYLGKNYGFKVSEADLAYTVYASNISVTVAKHGGDLMQLMFDLPEQEAVLTAEQALAVATKFLSETVAEHDLLIWQGMTNDGIYRMKFCPNRNGILCLDEEITVGVTGTSGRVCLFDAGDYYRSRGGDVKLPNGAMSAQSIAEIWHAEAVPCKVRLSAGVEAICFRVSDFFVDAVSGKRIDGVK